MTWRSGCWADMQDMAGITIELQRQEAATQTGSEATRRRPESPAAPLALDQVHAWPVMLALEGNARRLSATDAPSQRNSQFALLTHCHDVLACSRQAVKRPRWLRATQAIDAAQPG